MANTPISPKVTAGANAAAYATLLLTLLDSLAPDSLAFLGKLQPIAYGVVIGGSYALRAFLKADPLRDAGAAAQAAVAAPASDTPVAPQPDIAPAATFPAAKVEAAQASALAAVAPAVVEPVFEAPVAVAEVPVA
ncbi:hypothetical protein [Arthrobacter bambusae]|uniref:hypothetical protein n=1 Tax=Arthrobacter bambusae TaxID=1338426 RepID=UPI0027830CB8|nr:hypothetical protein [Arthrobacter bambusae]MDQ0241147.1 hypothetical protein [Arthrobacter bambusae]